MLCISGNADVGNLGELKSGPKNIYAGLNTREKVHIAMLQMKSRLEKEEKAINDYHAQRISAQQIALEPEMSGGAVSGKLSSSVAVSSHV